MCTGVECPCTGGGWPPVDDPIEGQHTVCLFVCLD